MHGIHSETNIKNVMHGVYCMAAPDMLSVIIEGINTHLKGGEWWLAGATALAISGLVAGLGWMISEFLRSGEVKAWSKKEIEEFITSAVIFSFIVGLVPLIAILVGSLTEKNYFIEAKDFLWNDGPATDSLYETNVLIANRLMGASTTTLIFWGTSFDLVRFVTDTAGNIEVLGLSTTGPVGTAAGYLLSVAGRFIGKSFFSMQVPYGSPLGNLYTAMVLVVNTSFMAAEISYAQYILLDFFQKTMFTFVLPIGIVMRAFPLTRKVGSSLIAIAIVGYIVYPLTVVLGKGIYLKSLERLPLELPEVGQFDLGVNITLNSPPVPGTTIKNDSVISWSILRPGEGVYRIWVGPYESSVQCSRFRDNDPAHGWFSVDKQPPLLPANYLTWTHSYYTTGTGGENECLFKSGAYDDQSTIKLSLSELVKAKEDDNRIYVFALDAYERNDDGSYTAIGFNKDAQYIVGDLCASSWWNKFLCAIKAEALLKGSMTLQTADLMVKGFVRGFLGFLKSGWWDSGRYSPLLGPSVFRPWKWTSDTFLIFTEKLPGLLFPSIMSIIILVTSLIVSVSIYRSIAVVIGGEEDLPGLAKIT